METGANDAYGAIIDNLRVTGEMCGDPEVTPLATRSFSTNWDFEQDVVGPNGFSEEAANAP